MRPAPNLNEIVGRIIVEAKLSDTAPYEPTSVTLTLDDGERFVVKADSIMYDQYSSSPCLSMRLERPELERKITFKRNERCPGVGAYAATRNSDVFGQCPGCGRSGLKLTQRGTIRFHKSMQEVTT